jgi:hypothetical protein
MFNIAYTEALTVFLECAIAFIIGAISEFDL